MKKICENCEHYYEPCNACALDESRVYMPDDTCPKWQIRADLQEQHNRDRLLRFLFRYSENDMPKRINLSNGWIALITESGIIRINLDTDGLPIFTPELLAAMELEEKA